jgi:hypothetical protein
MIRRGSLSTSLTILSDSGSRAGAAALGSCLIQTGAGLAVIVELDRCAFRGFARKDPAPPAWPPPITRAGDRRHQVEPESFSPAVPLACPKHRFATVAHGQHRSPGGASGQRRRQMAGTRGLLPKLAVLHGRIGLAVPGGPIRCLVAEDRSTAGVRDRTGPEPRACSQDHPTPAGTAWDSHMWGRGEDPSRWGLYGARWTPRNGAPTTHNQRCLGHVWGMDEGTARDNSGIERAVVIWL